MKEEIKTLIRSHYLAMSGYVSAGMEKEKNADTIYLNANESPFSLPGLEGFNRYPEPYPTDLLNALAKTYDVDAQWIMPTRGSDEALSLLSKCFCEPHKDSIAIHSPTFGMYSVNAKSLPAAVHEIPLLEDKGEFSLDKKALIQSNAKIIYLCSPNNPTANSFLQEDLLEIIEAKLGKSIIVLDEAYIEFSKQESFSSFLKQYPHLIILRTLSKAFSLAGIRLGCLISSDADFISFMKQKVGDIYPLPRPCIKAAITALSYADTQIQKNIDLILKERSRMEQNLKDISFIEHVYPSDTNFLLIKLIEDEAQNFMSFAKEHNIFLRDFSQNPHTKNCIRITIGSIDENDAVIALMKKYKEKN